MITLNKIRQSKAINAKAKKWARENLDYLNSKNRLLGSSLKVEKGEKEGYYTSIMYLQPADKIATVTLCAGAKLNGCQDPCLISSGQLGMTTGQNAATRRTIIYLLDRARFFEMLTKEIERKHIFFGAKLAIRLNGTSDIDFTDFIASMPHIRFYDYSKVFYKVKNNKLTNYDLTYSGSAYSAKSLAITARAVLKGLRVAIAFNTGERLGEFKIPSGIADFDTTDLRFLDKPVLGALKCKGGSKAKRAATMDKPNFFFTPATYNDLNNIIARG